MNVLPGLHLRYEPNERVLIRASVTRTLVRPDYRDMAPRQTVSQIDHRIAAGNPDLRPYEAINYDFSIDRYTEQMGLLSVGPFYKEISHFIVEQKRIVTLGELGDFIETRPVNGETAKVWGMETGWQSVPVELGVGARVSLECNYTFSKSEARLADRPGERLPLPDQAQHQAAIMVHVERKVFSADLGVHYHSQMLDNVVGSGRDVYLDDGYDMELNLAWKISKALKFTVGVVNLLRRPELLYSGDRQHQKEYEGPIRALNVGVQWRH